ncbi:UxaA family hydrolase [Labrys sp. KNU-23]|uniref:UxaA family hydrolase n=1 Tax=Labrys sp. KNU-23 TaxID=2789216 RepID=UPI0011EC694F|nr:UxaA family hydrolase [Labrys sp. KNU-23]QEN85671.1 UxaA family hydrolase [Labrys sp. KNU-23]
MQLDPRLLHLSPLDNVVVAREGLEAKAVLILDGRAFTLAGAVQRGHKIACRVIAPGEKIMKYGAPIGSAIRPIAPGEHVHLHNIKSDYTATHIIGSPATEAE